MYVCYFLANLALAVGFCIAARELAPSSSNIQVRNAPGASSAETLGLLRRSLSTAASKRASNTVFKNTTRLDKSWHEATLFSYESERDTGTSETGNSDQNYFGGVEIVCTTCYIKGNATAQLVINSGFNFSQAVDDTKSEISDEIDNFSTGIGDYVLGYINNTKSYLGNGVDASDFEFPPVNINFDIDVPEIPECELQFQFDGLELYMLVKTVFNTGVTYTINLYTSPSLFGVQVEDLSAGFVFTVDLILAVDTEIDISSGFHIRLSDGIAFSIPMFNDKVSNITFNGGDFEFLPVIVESGSVSLTASLRLGLTAGLSIPLPDEVLSNGVFKTFTDAYDIGFGAGIIAGIWVDIAQLKTTATAIPSDAKNIIEVCVVEELSFALGAVAGATLEFWDNRWGPTTEASTEIFTTTLAETCSSIPMSGLPLLARQDVEITTSTEEVIKTATRCLSTGLLNCPASLQTVEVRTAKQTLTATITSGADPIFETAVATSVSVIPFGTSSRRMQATSGTPKPDNFGGGDGQGGVNTKLAVGLSVGLALPILISLVVGIVYFLKRKRARKLKTSPPTYQPIKRKPVAYSPGSYAMRTQSSDVDVTEH